MVVSTDLDDSWVTEGCPPGRAFDRRSSLLVQGARVAVLRRPGSRLVGETEPIGEAVAGSIPMQPTWRRRAPTSTPPAQTRQGWAAPSASAAGHVRTSCPA